MTLYSQIFRRTALVQISNENRQTLTSDNSNSTFGFSNTNNQQITNNGSNSTFNSTQLTVFPARTAEETPNSFPPFSCLRLYTLARLVVASHGIILYILHISSSNRDIEKIIAFSGTFDLSSRCSPRSGIRDRAIDGIPSVPL
ncbi:hypothetical protein AVEN_105233-1 [Araneus ventricosus]|uniref:Uncharacterized protein n=1 Tax=Araneus ventricosus TaxID=182803 RepID=A0A4Y2TEF7_ARAVE|nr:hypothetical protein AVEN_105233-1 [Araneus ventricosus]